MTFYEKIPAAHEAIARMADGQRPCALVSFGKDSLVMLHLLRQVLGPVPVVSYQEPQHPRRWKFAARVAEAWDLEVHRPAPARTWVYGEGEHFVLGQSYDIGGGQLIDIPRDVIPWDFDEATPTTCGLDHLAQPTGAMATGFTLAFIGHKDTDRDPVLGAVPLKSDIVRTPPGAMDAAYPLRGWTDADVWDYSELYNLPIDEGKYDPAARAPRGDRSANNDYLAACVACLRAPATETVPCPKYGAAPGCRDAIPWMPTLERPYFTTPDREEVTP